MGAGTYCVSLAQRPGTHSRFSSPAWMFLRTLGRRGSTVVPLRPLRPTVGLGPEPGGRGVKVQSTVGRPNDATRGSHEPTRDRTRARSARSMCQRSRTATSRRPRSPCPLGAIGREIVSRDGGRRRRRGSGATASSVSVEGARPRCRTLGASVTIVVVLFWVSLAALVWTHVGYPACRCSGRVSPRPVARPAMRLPRVTVIVAAHDEESGDRAPGREPARARLPGRPARDHRRLGRLDDGTDELAAAAGARVIRNAARRQGRRPGPGGARDARRRSSPSRTPTRSGSRTRCAQLVAPVRRSRRSPTSAVSSGSRPPTARTARASTGATRWRCGRPSRGSARSPAATARSTRVRRSDYVEVDPALRSRPLAALPDGAARSARRLRAGGARLREADAERTRASTGARCGCSSTAG